MQISASLVKELRERSGAGMMECKEALKECDGDIERAFDALRKKGAAKAAKKADRSTKQGLISVAVDGPRAALVELKCETDFVARNETFKALADQIAQVAARDGGDGLADRALGDGSDRTVSELIVAAVQMIGENLTLGRVERVELDGAGGFGSYIHAGGSIATLIELGLGDESLAGNEIFTRTGKDLAMHIAAMSPIALDPSGIPEESLKRERELFRSMAAASGKPESIIEKMVAGRERKYYDEVTLLNQPFVKDTTKSVSDVLAERSKELGSPISARRFIRMQLGE